MREVIQDQAESELTDDSTAGQIRETLDGQFVCPFCGVVNSTADGLCPRCSMENTPVARKATRERIGPWFVYQHRNPAAPGMKFETLLTFVRSNKVKPRSIVRGPTTSQLWRFAAHVKGLSREFGVCYSCGGAIEATTNLCPHCKRLQEPPPNPDVLLESGEGEAARRAAPAAPATSSRPPAAAAGKRPPGPFSNGASDTDLPTRDDLSSDDEAPVRRPLPKTEPVASFRKPQAGDNFLSARELATAFNLGFNSASPPQGKPRKRKARWGRRLFVLFLLAAIAAGAVIWTRPVLHQQAVNWGVETWKKIQPLFASKPSAPNKASARQVDDKQPAASESSHSPVVVNASNPDSTKTDAIPKKDAQQTASNAPKPDNAAGSRSGIPPKVTEVVVGSSNPSTPQAPVKNPQDSTGNQPSEKPVASDQNPAAASTEDAERANTLYSQGLDAEQRMDFTTAAKCYEQIMKLPKEVWRSDVEVRLRLARYQAEHH